MIRILLLTLIAAVVGGAQPAFDVASIKPADLSTAFGGLRFGPDTFATRGRLRDLVQIAYDLEYHQVDAGPAWANNEFYDVQAKAAAPATRDQLKAMLRTLLDERFHLKLTRETRTMSGYILSVDKNGPKLPPAKIGVPPESTGTIQVGGGEFWARGATMKTLSRGLQAELESPVLNQTNIEGHYDFKLKFEENMHDPAEPPSDGTRPSIFTAIRDLGLRLEARKIPVEVFVIESAERPSAN